MTDLIDSKVYESQKLDISIENAWFDEWEMVQTSLFKCN